MGSISPSSRMLSTSRAKSSGGMSGNTLARSLMGYSICISTPRPPPGDRHSTQGPGVFTFTPAPVSSLVGWNGLRHPPGPDNVPQRRQSDTGPLRSGPPKAGDRSSRDAGTPAGIPGSAGVSGNPKPGPHSRHRDLPANGLGPGTGGPSSITNRNRLYGSRIPRVAGWRYGRPVAIHRP